MPKRRRKERLSLPAPAHEIRSETVYWPTAEKLRAQCPMCNMYTDVDHFYDGPYVPKVKLFRFGGKVKKTMDDGTEKTVGYMEYFDVPEEDSEPVLRQMLALLDGVRAEILAALGEEEAEEAQETGQAPQGGYVAAPVVERQLPPSLQRKPEPKREPLEELPGQLDLLPPLPEDEEEFERGELLPPARRQRIQGQRRQPKQVTARPKQGQLQPRPQRKQLASGKPKRGELKPVAKRQQIQAPKSNKQLPPPPNRPGLPPGKK